MDDLLDALLAAKPLPPGPEWETLKELHAKALEKGQKITFHAMRTRMQNLAKQGKVEQRRGPRRGIGTGVAVYYRLKGKP